MKKFYCLYNKNNFPFSWKLKEAKGKALAHFKTKEDALNYYLSLDNIGIIWFQKSISKKINEENLKDSFDGYIKTIDDKGVLKHTIVVVSTDKENKIKIFKKNLCYALQINLETGEDLLKEKGVDRLYYNRNSYLIIDNDIVEEVMSVYDMKESKSSDSEVYSNKKILDFDDNQFDSAKSLRDMISKSSEDSNVKLDEIKTEEIIVKAKKEENKLEPTDQKIFNSTENNSIEFEEYESHVPTNQLEENSVYYDPKYNSYQEPKYNSYQEPKYNSYQDEYGMQDNYSNYHNNENFFRNNVYDDQIYQNMFGVNINDFNFQNDFLDYNMNMTPINQDDFINYNFSNYNFLNKNNNNDKISRKNNFYKIINNKGNSINMNQKNKRYDNLHNTGSQNWNAQEQYSQVPWNYNDGTVEFTAVPNQMLNTNINPLGTNTMIFNPYNNMQNHGVAIPYNNIPDPIIQKVIQPIIQPVISTQTIYNNTPQILEPIVNPPVLSSDYYDYAQVALNSNHSYNNNQQQYSTSEFKFNNNSNNDYMSPNSTNNNHQPVVNNSSKELDTYNNENTKSPLVTKENFDANKESNEKLSQELEIMKKRVANAEKESKLKSQKIKSDKVKVKKTKLITALISISILISIAALIVVVLIITNVIVF